MPGQGASTVSGVAQGTGASVIVSNPYAKAAGGGSNTLPFLLMGIQAVSSLFGAKGQADASSAYGENQADIYDTNARLKDLLAEDAIIRGDRQAVKAKQSAKRLIGSQRAALAAQGIDIESGSALDIQEETASLGAEDALNIRNNAWRESWGYKVQANNYRSAASISRTTAKNKSKNTLLTGGLNAVKDIFVGYNQIKTGSGKTIEDYLSGGF